MPFLIVPPWSNSKKYVFIPDEKYSDRAVSNISNMYFYPNVCSKNCRSRQKNLLHSGANSAHAQKISAPPFIPSLQIESVLILERSLYIFFYLFKYSMFVQFNNESYVRFTQTALFLIYRYCNKTKDISRYVIYGRKSERKREK